MGVVIEVGFDHALFKSCLCGKEQGFVIFYSERSKCSQCHGGNDFHTLQDDNQDFVKFDCNIIRIPSLRNIALTYPYFHDGRENSIFKAIKSHVTNCLSDDRRLSEIDVSDSDVKKLVSFLYTLTDTTYMSLPYYTNPHK